MHYSVRHIFLIISIWIITTGTSLDEENDIGDIMIVSNKYKMVAKDLIPDENNSNISTNNITNKFEDHNDTLPSNEFLHKMVGNTSNHSYYGSFHNPAKSCKDLSSENILKDQPEMFYIETVDKELLQVFCPQSYTFLSDMAHSEEPLISNLTTLINGEALNFENNTSIIILNGTASTNGNETLNNGDSINIIINQTSSFDSNGKQVPGQSRDGDSEYQNMSVMTEKIENRDDNEYNTTLPGTQNINHNDLYYASKDNKPINENEASNPDLNTLISKHNIYSNVKDRKSKIKLHKIEKGRSFHHRKSLKLKEKMKIPLYKPLNTLFKSFSNIESNVVKDKGSDEKKTSKSKHKSSKGKEKATKGKSGESKKGEKSIHNSTKADEN